MSFSILFEEQNSSDSISVWLFSPLYMLFIPLNGPLDCLFLVNTEQILEQMVCSYFLF